MALVRRGVGTGLALSMLVKIGIYFSHIAELNRLDTSVNNRPGATGAWDSLYPRDGALVP